MIEHRGFLLLMKINQSSVFKIDFNKWTVKLSQYAAESAVRGGIWFFLAAHL